MKLSDQFPDPHLSHKYYIKEDTGLLTSCANILYSSSLVTEILSLSVLSTTTITNFKKPKVISQHFKEHTTSFQPRVLTQNRSLLPSAYSDSWQDYQVASCPTYRAWLVTHSTAMASSSAGALYTKQLWHIFSDLHFQVKNLFWEQALVSTPDLALFLALHNWGSTQIAQMICCFCKRVKSISFLPLFQALTWKQECKGFKQIKNHNKCHTSRVDTHIRVTVPASTAQEHKD